jgi:hypothetical protein
VTRPRLRVLSLGAGVQSSTALLAAEGRIPACDVALLADTGWEAHRTCAHLGKLSEHEQRAGITGQAFISLTALRDTLTGGES